MGNPDTNEGAVQPAEVTAAGTGFSEPVLPAPTPVAKATPAPLRREVNGVILGEKYRDTVMGIEGVAMTYVTHLTGCNRVGIEWVNKEGNVRSEFVDETRLVHSESGEQVEPEDDKPGHCGDPPSRGLR